MLNIYTNYIIWNKVLNQITHRKNKLWRFLPVERISKKGIDDIPTKDDFQHRVLTLLGSSASIIKNVSSEERDVILNCAEQTINHRFNLLGSGAVQMQSILWNDDFKTGNRWNTGVFYLKQRKSTRKGADIKVPWELSRCHHLLWLGEAYLLTNEERFAKEIVDEINDWIENNPFMYSVNWVCAMDVAIRAVNWLYSISFIIESPFVDDFFVAKVYTSLFQHGWFIFNNLERTVPYSSNHFFSDLSGLLYLSSLFCETERGKGWMKFVENEYYEEIRREFLPSGPQFERSVSYHRLVTELAIAPYCLLKRLGKVVPADIEERLSRMLSFVSNYTKANGRSPLISDNDDGRFLPFVKRDYRSHEYLIDTTSLEYRILFNGVDALHYCKRKESKLYYDAGFAILRNNDAYLFVTNGEQSEYDGPKKEVGTHTHNDKLSFELSLGNDDLIVDPGAYIYTPNPVANLEFRSTIKHNTVLVDDEEQNGLDINKVFVAKRNSHATHFRFADNICEGGYRTFDGGLLHSRSFSLFDDSLCIQDHLEKKGKAHKAVLSYHLDDKILVSLEDKTAIMILPNKIATISIEVEGTPLDLSVVDDTISPSYGILIDSKTLRTSAFFDDEIIIKTIIRWEARK